MKILLLITIIYSVAARPQEHSEEAHSQYGAHLKGDIILPLPKASPRNGLIDPDSHWPNGIVSYIFDEGLQEQKIPIILDVMEEFKTTSGGCIQFVERTDEPNYIRITGDDDGGCISSVGMVGGEQQTNFPQWCVDVYGSVFHVIYHSMGFHHEENRYDRDDYVIINWAMLSPSQRLGYVKYDNETVSNYGEPYDYLSIMHSSAQSFGDSEPIIYTIDPAYQDLIGQRDGPTQSDWNKVLRMYECIE